MLNTTSNNYAFYLKLDNDDKLGILRKIAYQVASLDSLNKLTIYNEILDNELQGSTIFSHRVAFCFAVNDEIKMPQIFLFSLDNAVAWGNDEQMVDYIVIAILPNGFSNNQFTLLNSLVSQVIRQNASQLNNAKKDQRALSKLNEFFESINFQIQSSKRGDILNIFQELRNIYITYGDTNSLLRVEAYILNGSILQVRQIRLEKIDLENEILELPVGMSSNDKIIFFKPNKKLARGNMATDIKTQSHLIKNLLERLILLQK
ncbi:PTS sugar transporter subunit IIA [Companilactobacillus halodurans]|uniref:PTS sugar transporter subunit IIA n=1 Tax=Companilactobacillus halodurans TaxID=2584183 RepID=UPI001295F154|nr:PTS sugar transporter subunit IIA [Companilactobacillus halodurans]